MEKWKMEKMVNNDVYNGHYRCCRPTGTPHAHANILQTIERSVPSTISMAGVPIIPM